MRDFNFVSIKIQSFFGVKFLKKQINYFHKCSLKYFFTTFLQNVSLFRMSEFCFFLFYSVQQVGFLSRMTRFFLSRMLINEMYSFFLIFLILIFNFQKSRIGLFVMVFLTLCPYSSHSRLFRSSFVLAPTFIFVILIFSVVKKLNEFSLFVYLGFFGLQLI